MRVVVIGGGCSGVVSAICAKNNENEVIILERNNTLLKKLLLTGAGRCNYFNEVYSTKDYHSENIDLVDKFISDNNIDMALNFFDKLGVIPRIKNGYYYPFSNQAISIKNLLINEIDRLKIKVEYNTYVENIEKKDDEFIVECENKKFVCDKVIISSGGFAYPKTGSNGDRKSVV